MKRNYRQSADQTSCFDFVLMFERDVLTSVVDPGIMEVGKDIDLHVHPPVPLGRNSGRNSSSRDRSNPPVPLGRNSSSSGRSSKKSKKGYA